MTEITKEMFSLPSRENVTNKGDAGRVLIVGADVGMCGAAAFAAESAYRSGCGLVKAYIHPENRIPLQTLVPEAVLSFWEEKDFENLSVSLEWADAVLVGVGFGQGEKQKQILKFILKNCKKPLVLDADALNIISKSQALFSKIPSGSVLTPHILELSRLTGASIERIKEDTIGVLLKAFDTNFNVCAKDSVTRIITTDKNEYQCSQGDSSLSTGGTGDVLAGMITSFAAQGMSPSKALIAGVYLHALSGKSAGQRLGVRSVIARDVIAEIPNIIKNF